MTPRAARWRWAPVAALILLALAASAGGIRNGFTYDDRYIIVMNGAAHHLHHWWRLFKMSYWPPDWGAEGYRPITSLFFAVEWVAGRGAPWVFHGVNVVLYLATTAAVFALASSLLPTWAAWLAAAFFAVHPVHVEAVANSVGQSELWVALATVLATALYVRARRGGAESLSSAVAVGVVALYAFACFAKEHGIVLPALLVVAELVLIKDPRAPLARFRAQRTLALALAGVAIVFLVARAVVLSSVGFGGFHPFIVFQTLNLSTRDRILTMLGVVPQWIRLLLWPARLAAEYAPPEIDIAQGLSVTQLPGFLLLGSIVGLAIALVRRRPVVSFGIAWLCITLLPSSNFILPAGIIIAERTLFLPSVGAMIAVAGCIAWAAERVHTSAARSLPAIGTAACALVLLAGVARSARRTTVWHDNERLFRQSVVDSPLAYRAHYMLGAWAFENNRKREGEQEYLRALSLFPYDPFLAFSLAEQYRLVGLCGAALPYYRWSQTVFPTFPVGHAEFAFCLMNEGQYAEAKTQLRKAMVLRGRTTGLRTLLASADSGMAAELSPPNGATHVAKLNGRTPLGK